MPLKWPLAVVLGDFHMSMEVRRYKPKDWDTVNSWFLSRNMPSMPKSVLPPTGFIVDGIGAAFLYKTDGGVALLENYISNPLTTHQERIEALDLVTEALVLEAVKCKFKVVVAFSKVLSVSDNCKNHNFKLLGTFEMFAKEL